MEKPTLLHKTDPISIQNKTLFYHEKSRVSRKDLRSAGSAILSSWYIDRTWNKTERAHPECAS